MTPTLRVHRALAAPALGSVAGFGAAFVSAVWLRAATGGADLVWSLVPAPKVAVWMWGMAHGVPLEIRSTAAITAPEASVQRLGRLLSTDGGREVAFAFSVLVVPLSLLLVGGTVTALLVRRARPAGLAALATSAAVSGGVYGAVVALAVALGDVVRVFEGTIAPELGLEGATGHVGVAIGGSPLTALAVGAAWGAAFAVAGGLASPPLRNLIVPSTRVTMRGWLRGVGVAAGVVGGLLALGVLGALVTGRLPSLALAALGVWLLTPNVVATGLVLSHGVSMRVALDAGPFTGWERLDLLNVGAGGGTAVWPWLFVACPLAAGIVAGRYVGARTGLPTWRIGVAFGALWAMTMAVLALLLRVRVLTSFSVGELALGGGSAAVDPVAALLAGLAAGAAAAVVGAAWVRRRAAMPSPVGGLDQ